jgi:cytochrome c oxidase subunit 2
MWSLLFLLVPLLATGSVVMAALNIAPLDGLWTPKNQNLDERRIDGLMVTLHVVSAVVLMGTGLFLAWIVWRGTATTTKAARYVSHNTTLEIVWSAIPAAILLWLALSQYSAWSESRLERPTIETAGVTRDVPASVLVVSRRFGWEFHHAGADGKTGTADDVINLNRLIVPGDRDVVLEMRSRDVIHNFCVPTLRIKQDIVPGLSPLVWFRAPVGYQTEIICTELCGWGHYLMQARLETVAEKDHAERIAQLAKFESADLEAGE